MMKRLQLILVLLALGCGVWIVQRMIESDRPAASALQRFGSPMSYDPTPVKVKFGGRYYAIPKNHIDAPLQPKGMEGEFRIITGLFLVGVLPDFDGRNSKTWPSEISKGESKLRLHVLIKAPAGAGPVKSIFYRGKSIYMPNEGNIEIDTPTFRASNFTSRDGETTDYYVDKDTGFYTICNRLDRGKRVRICTLRWYEDEILVEITMHGSQLDRRDELRALISGKIKSWEVEPNAGSQR